MATPHVAGAWAVARQKYPTNTVDEIEALFKGSGVTITVGGVSAAVLLLWRWRWFRWTAAGMMLCAAAWSVSGFVSGP
jgi:hypothetical protein